jgi:hypothetical protein
MTNARTQVLTFIFASLALACNADAGIIFSNFGPGNSSHTTSSLEVGGSASFLGLVEQAAQFTPSGSGIWKVSQIDAPFFYATGTPSIILTLNSDNAGQPGGILASWNLTLPSSMLCIIVPDPGSCPLQSVTPSSPLFLSSGTQYWLVASPTASDTNVDWFLNSTNSTNLSKHNSGSGWVENSGLVGAFDIQGNPAPEPASLSLFMFGFTCLGVIHIRKTRRYKS